MNLLNQQSIFEELQKIDPHTSKHDQILRMASRDESVFTQNQVLAVCFPTSTQMVSQLLAFAYAQKVPVIPRGAGSGLSGAAVPFQPSIIVSLEKMDQILNIDEKNLSATVQPGVITGVLKKEVEKKKLYYPPLPSSMDYCTLGGNVATNAGGLCAVKYGVTRKYVTGLEVVLSNGNIIHTGGTFVKHSTGYDLTQLFLGSEGTLGIITEINVSLLPLPSHKDTLLIGFQNMQDSSSFVCELLCSGHTPSTLEIIPHKAIDLVLKMAPDLKSSLAFNDQVYLLIEYDAFSEGQNQSSLETIAMLCEQRNVDPVFCSSDQQRENIWAIRRRIREAISKTGLFVEADAVVPRSKLTELVIAGENVSQEFGVEVFSYGHAGDGNLHTYFIAPDSWASQWPALEKKVLASYFKQTVALGGTISGEHGIGELKKEFLPLVFPPAYIQVLSGIKNVFDPKNILNPGKVFIHE